MASVDIQITGNNNLVNLAYLSLHDNIQFLLTGVGHFLRLHTDKGKDKCHLFFIYEQQGKSTVGIRRSS